MASFPQGLFNIDKRCANAGERLVLHQLKRLLSDDHLVWHNVPLGPKGRQPDFVILSPRQGILVLEVKHWKSSSLAHADRDSVTLRTSRGQVTEANPIRQARDYVMELVDLMQADPALVRPAGPFGGKLLFPYGWGAVFSGIRSVEIADSDFAEVFSPHKVLLRDDLLDDVDEDTFQRRLWGMFTVHYPHTLTLPQRDRIRWHLFPDIRVGAQSSMFDETQEKPAALNLPDLLQVMDLQQEQVARALGEGHRVIHGAAGSGKTMILVFRAQQLAAATRPDKPILVLCYNRMLARHIDRQLRERGVDERVVVRTFHGWCQDMVRHHHLDVPKNLNDDAYYQALAHVVDRAIQTGFVPSGQYTALMIDEAHDFDEAWLRLAVRLVDPSTHSLLVLYDDAQSIYQKKRRAFRWVNVGVQAQGRTSVLKLNYRNTAEVLALAMHCAQSLLQERTDDEGLIKTVHPASAGRRGPLPVLIEACSEAEEANLIAERAAQAISEGLPAESIAILFRARSRMPAVAAALRQHGVAVQSMSEPDFDWHSPSVRLMTLHGAKGLEFSLVFIAGLDCMPWRGESMEEEVRLLYVGMTRATHQLILSAARTSPIVDRVRNSLEVAAQQFGA